MIVKHARKWFFPAKNREVVTDEKENASRCVAAFGAADAAWHHPAGGVCRRGTDGDFHRRGGPPENGNSIAPTVSDGKAFVASKNKEYESLDDAMADAADGDTIYLGAGTYGLYKSDTATTPEEKAAWKALMKEKTFTFVGQNPQETFWNIGTPTVEQSGEANGDYSFDGAEQVTFKKMTLLASVTPDGKKESRNYTGFIRANNTLVEDCVIDGMTFYWGYVSAEFKNTKFICGQNKYAFALWTYSSPLETFDHCTFDASANPERSSVIYVHNDGSDKHFTINFKDCTVIAPQSTDHNSPKQVLYIEDSNPRKFTINISGKNIINGDVPVDNITCSRLFGFGGKDENNNSNTIVNFGNTTVWQNGNMVDAKTYHNSGVTEDGVNYNNNVDGSNDSLYAEGYKDNAFDTTTSAWTTNPDGTITRDVTKKCTYCGYEENGKEYQVKLTYDTNGGEGAIESATGAAGENVTVAENVFTRNNYTFTGWNTQADGKGTAYKPGDSFTLTDKDTVLYAQWNKLVTVSFDLCGHGGANISSQTFVSGNKASEPTAPKEDGWVFGGWYTEKGCKYRFSFDSAVTSDITLYAKWDRVTTVVSAPVATPTPSPAPVATPTPSPAAAATKTATVKNAAIPQTSDVFPMEGLLALLAVGAVGFGAAGWLRKKHH